MRKTIAILQSSYIPWKGYFDIIAAVDEFAIFDEAQYTRRDWRNRNRIVSGGQARWLTIPVASKGRYTAPINEIRIADPGWADRHWTTLCHAYSDAPYFPAYRSALAAAYEKAERLEFLHDVNVLFLETICGILELPTVFTHSDRVPRMSATATERLVEICVARNAGAYLSGPAARDYIVRETFSENKIELYYANYSGYPTYLQGPGTFEHRVSMLDTLFRCGQQARQHLKSLDAHRGFLQSA